MYIMMILLLGSVCCGFTFRMSHGAQTRLALVASIAATLIYIFWQGAM